MPTSVLASLISRVDTLRAEINSAVFGDHDIQEVEAFQAALGKWQQAVLSANFRIGAASAKKK
jgi:hypothetical protein